MGTRHVSYAAIDGEYKIAQYGQWDGDPSGAGVTILEFLRKRLKSSKAKEQFKQQLRDLKAYTEEEIKAIYDAAGPVSPEGWVSSQAADKVLQTHPQISRDTGADVLGLVLDGAVDTVRLNLTFVGDSLFCEWAYVIDFDKDTFEVFVGSMKKLVPDDQRFPSSKFKTEPEHYQKKGEIYPYHPVRLLKSYPLSLLPPPGRFCRELFKLEEEASKS